MSIIYSAGIRKVERRCDEVTVIKEQKRFNAPKTGVVAKEDMDIWKLLA